MADIVLDKVSKQFPDGTTAIRDVDLQIADGEFVILVGPSGCGKSTTLCGRGRTGGSGSTWKKFTCSTRAPGGT